MRVRTTMPEILITVATIMVISRPIRSETSPASDPKANRIPRRERTEEA